MKSVEKKSEHRWAERQMTDCIKNFERKTIEKKKSIFGVWYKHSNLFHSLERAGADEKVIRVQIK